MKCDEKSCWLATVIHSFRLPAKLHSVSVFLPLTFGLPIYLLCYLFNNKKNRSPVSFSFQPNLSGQCTILCASGCLCVRHNIWHIVKLCLEKDGSSLVSGFKVWCETITKLLVVWGADCREAKDGGRGVDAWSVTPRQVTCLRRILRWGTVSQTRSELRIKRLSFLLSSPFSSSVPAGRSPRSPPGLSPGSLLLCSTNPRGIRANAEQS